MDLFANRAIVWFRQDLRLHDNEALTNAVQRAKEIVPVFVFDERIFTGTTAYGLSKTGKFRTRFIIECIEDLRNSFQERGIDLVIRVGKPEIEVAKLAEQIDAKTIYCNIERTQEEVED